MNQKLLSLGWIVPIISILGSLILGFTLPEYNTAAQTLSEIGEEGSPYYLIWMIFSFCIDMCITLFGIGILLYAKSNKLSKIPAIFIIGHGLSGIGASIFPTPHSLHNLFGSSNLIWYCAPLMFALIWKTKRGKMFRNVSTITFFTVIVFGTVLNLNPMFEPSLYPMKYYGVAQRYIIYGFNIYCAFTALTLLNYRDE